MTVIMIVEVFLEPERIPGSCRIVFGDKNPFMNDKFILLIERTFLVLINVMEVNFRVFRV